MSRPKKVIKAKEPVRIRFKELQNGNKSIYLDIYRNGKRTYEFLKLYLVPELDPASRAMNQHNMTLANKIKADRIIELTNNEKGVSNIMLRGRIKLSELLDLYARWLEDNGKHTTIRSVNSIRKATSQFRGDVPLRMIDKDYCMAFMNFLRNDYKARTNRPITMTTAAGYVTVFSAMLNWAVRNDYLSENPFTHIAAADRIHRPESKREFLQIDELKKLIATECPTRRQTGFPVLLLLRPAYQRCYQPDMGRHPQGRRPVEGVHRNGKDKRPYISAVIPTGDEVAARAWRCKG